jgi:hypothetical protein
MFQVMSYQGINSCLAVMNQSVTTTETAFTHRPTVDQLLAESAPPSSCAFAHDCQTCNVAPHTCRKAHTFANIFFLTPCNAFHQPVATLQLPAAHAHTPVQWAHHPPAGCTSLPDTNQGIVHINPVAASLRLLDAEHMFIGVVPLLRRTAKELQHYLRTAKPDWATPAAASARWAWAAVVGYGVQLGQVHATAALGQVCDPAPASDIASAHLSGEAAVVAHILSDLYTVVAPWVMLFVQSVMSVCITYPLLVTVCLIIVLCAELLYWLIRWATGHGLAMASAMAEIAAAPETHRMSLRFQLHRYATGRQRRRLRTVRSTSRPKRLRDQYAEPSALQLRALSILVVTLIAGYAYVAMIASTQFHSYMESNRPVVEPSQTCWHTPDVWLGTGVVTCGYPTTETDHTAFPSWEQGGAGTSLNVLPSRAEFQAIWKILSESCLTLVHAFGHPSWSVPEAWDLPGSLLPLIIPPAVDLPQITPAFQTACKTFAGTDMRTILASASDLALATTQRSLTSQIFALTKPLTALLVAGGLPLAPSALASACLGAWVSLLAALLSQLSWFNLTLLLVSTSLPILDKVWPVCATNVPPGSTDFSTSCHGGVADCSCTPGGTCLYDVHRSARRGAAKKKRKTRCAGHPCSEVATCERKGATKARAESAVVEEGENKKVSPVGIEKTVNEPTPALAIPKGLNTLGTAIERDHDDIPGKGGDTGVMNQCVSHSFAEATRVASWTVSSLAHWLEACSLVNLRLSRNSRLEEEENSSLGKNAFLGKEEEIAENTESDPEGAPCAHSCQCCRIPDSDSDDDEMPPLIGPDEINEGEAHVSPLFAVLTSVAYIFTYAVTMPCFALRCVAVRTFRLLCVPFVICSSLVLLLFCLVRCLVVLCTALPRWITQTDLPSAPVTEPEEGTFPAGEEPAAVKA